MRPRTRRVTAQLLAAGLAFASLSACRDPLLRVDDERSQFDRYRLARDDYPAPFVMDEFGRRRPNLRGRLLPQD